MTTAMMVALGGSEDSIKSLDDFAGCVADDLIGWVERKDGEVIRHGGIIDSFDLTRQTAEDMIMFARVKLGWIDEHSAIEESAEEVEELEEEVERRSEVTNVIEDTTV